MAAGVVTVTTLLWFVFPKKSRTDTLNSYVLAGERSRTSADLDPSMSPPYGLPSTRSVYQTWLPTSSTDVVQATETRTGQTPVTESVGALGGVVSGGVV